PKRLSADLGHGTAVALCTCSQLETRPVVGHTLQLDAN
ncbi:MAG: hypothetical protein QOK28_2704, partial [Actinomycetota bacterium]